MITHNANTGQIEFRREKSSQTKIMGRILENTGKVCVAPMLPMLGAIRGATVGASVTNDKFKNIQNPVMRNLGKTLTIPVTAVAGGVLGGIAGTGFAVHFTVITPIKSGYKGIKNIRQDKIKNESKFAFQEVSKQTLIETAFVRTDADRIALKSISDSTFKKTRHAEEQHALVENLLKYNIIHKMTLRLATTNNTIDTNQAEEHIWGLLNLATPEERNRIIEESRLREEQAARLREEQATRLREQKLQKDFNKLPSPTPEQLTLLKNHINEDTICPISLNSLKPDEEGHSIKNPVALLTPDRQQSHLYDLEELHKHFITQNTDPMTREPITLDAIIRNNRLLKLDRNDFKKSAIDNVVKKKLKNTVESTLENTLIKKTKNLLTAEKKIFEAARTMRAKNIALASGDNLSPKDRDALINEAPPYVLLPLANRKDLSPEHIDALINKGDNHVFKALEKNHTLTPEQKEAIKIKRRIEI